MTKLTIGTWVTAQKLPSKTLVLDRLAFLDRTQTRDTTPTVVCLPLIGVGDSCGKPCSAQPYTLTWTKANTQVLEQLAAECACFVERGVYLYLKLHDGGQKAAAVHDWTTCATASLRSGYEHTEEVLLQLLETLQAPLYG